MYWFGSLRAIKVRIIFQANAQDCTNQIDFQWSLTHPFSGVSGCHVVYVYKIENIRSTRSMCSHHLKSNISLTLLQKKTQNHGDDTCKRHSL